MSLVLAISNYGIQIKIKQDYVKSLLNEDLSVVAKSQYSQSVLLELWKMLTGNNVLKNTRGKMMNSSDLESRSDLKSINEIIINVELQRMIYVRSYPAMAFTFWD